MTIQFCYEVNVTRMNSYVLTMTIKFCYIVTMTKNLLCNNSDYNNWLCVNYE